MNNLNNSAILAEFAEQAKNSPGGDVYIAACYRAVEQTWETKDKLRRLVERVQAKRNLPPQYFVNLFFRCLQYIEMNYRTAVDYPADLSSVKSWIKELDIILNDHAQLLEKLITTQDTTTTIYQRYAGPKAILEGLWPDKTLKVADFGCGGNYGLRGIISNQPFNPIVDHTPHKLLSELIKSPLNITSALAIDKDNPKSSKAKKWRLSCSLYPSEFSQMPALLEFERKISHVRRVKFLQQDLQSVKNGNLNNKIPGFDCVIMSTLLYQIPSDQEKIMASAGGILNPDGIIIVQDFSLKSNNKPSLLQFGIGWFKKPFTYRTFMMGKITNWKLLEIFQWNNGRCKEVQAGEDFNQFRSMIKLKA